MRPSDVTTSSWPSASCVRRAVEARAGGSTCRPAGTRRRAAAPGRRAGVGSSDGEQVVDVDRLGRQPAAHDVVAGAHQLDAGAAEVGVEVARAELDRLAGLQPDEVEQQRRRRRSGRRGSARPAGAPTSPRAGRSLAAAATIGSTWSRPRYSAASASPGPCVGARRRPARRRRARRAGRAWRRPGGRRRTPRTGSARRAARASARGPGSGRRRTRPAPARAPGAPAATAARRRRAP